MGQARPRAPRSTRWLAGAVVLLVLAGVVSAGVLAADDDGPGPAVVSAAGGQSGTVDVTSTVTVTLPVPTSAPAPTGQTTTTRPRAAEDVLNAIAGSTTTTRRPTTTTTRPLAPTTTVPTPTTAPSTTTTVARFRVTLLNSHPNAVELIVNGEPFRLTPTQERLDVDLPLSSRGDVVHVRVLGQDCHVTDSGVIFKAGGSYDVTIVPGETLCNGGTARPRLTIAPR